MVFVQVVAAMHRWPITFSRRDDMAANSSSMTRRLWGIFGHSIGPTVPYGKGGGGLLPYNGLSDPNVLVISSLAKAFGVPLAVIAGSQTAISYFDAHSKTRVHCSPPSIAALRAAENVLDINAAYGDELRHRLAQRVRHFRQGLKQIRLEAVGGLFPVQTLRSPPHVEVLELHERLLDRGLRTVLHGGRNGARQRVSFIITVRHRADEIEQAVTGLTSIMQTASLQSQATYARHG